MAGSRESVLERLRRARGRDADAERAARETVDARIARAEPNLIPARARRQHPELVDAFVEMAREAAASVARVPDEAAVPAAAAEWLAAEGLPGRAVIAPESPLHALGWPEAGVEVESRLARSGDEAAVASAWAGIAESGTLVLCSGPENPVTANFLPENELVVLRARDVVGASEDVWARLRERGEGVPRTVNWITGPSRSGDIELTMLMGAHGPVRLHVILVDDLLPPRGSDRQP